MSGAATAEIVAGPSLLDSASVAATIGAAAAAAATVIAYAAGAAATAAALIQLIYLSLLPISMLPLPWLSLLLLLLLPSLLKSNVLRIISCSPSLFVKRFHCISEISGRLIGVDSRIQTSQRSVGNSCKVRMDRIIFLITNPEY